MSLEKIIGEKINEIRSRRGLTLAQVSEQTKISVAMLSKIENAKASSPISTYARIAKALMIPLGQLFSIDGDVPLSLVRKEERIICTKSVNCIGESIAFKKTNKKMEPFFHIYPPKVAKPPVRQHDNEELIFVIKGKLEFQYDETMYILSPGDCIYFDANKKHSVRALGNETAHALVVNA